MSNVIRDFISYNLGSVNKQIYKDLSKCVKVSAFYVYRLSKGKAARSGQDFKILGLLKEKGVISEIRYRYN